MKTVYIFSNSQDIRNRMVQLVERHTPELLIPIDDHKMAEILIFPSDWAPSDSTKRNIVPYLNGPTAPKYYVVSPGLELAKEVGNLWVATKILIRPKIYICGYGRHGKTAAAKYLSNEFGCTFADSSLFAAEKAVFPTLKERHGYKTVEECHADRHNHREEWFNLIAEYCDPLDRLSAEIFEVNDIYVGIRSKDELEAARHLCDLVVWVDASSRLGPEPPSSISVTREDCDIVVDNNGTEEDFHRKLKVLGHLIYKR